MGKLAYKASNYLPEKDDIVVFTSVFDSAEYLIDSDQWVVVEIKDDGQLVVRNKVQNRFESASADSFYLIYQASNMVNDGKSLGYYQTPLVKAQLYDDVILYLEQKLYIGIIESLSGYLHQTAEVRLQGSDRRVSRPVTNLILISHKSHEIPFDTNEMIQNFQSRTLMIESVDRKEVDKCCKYVNVDRLPQIHDRVVFETAEEEDDYYHLHFPSAVAKVMDISEDGKTAELELPVNHEKDFTFTAKVNELYYVGKRK